MLSLQVAAFVGSSMVGRFGEQGLANTLGLATLRHGTNVVNWLSIHILGTIPGQGGSFTGADFPNKTRQNKDKTYFFYSHPKDIELDSDNKQVKTPLVTRVGAKESAFNSNVNLMECIETPTFISYPIAFLAAAIMPSVKVHLPDDVVKPRPELDDNLHADFKRETSQFCNYSTDKRVLPWNMGVIGSVWNSLTPKTVGRMVNNPWRVVTGVMQLGLTAVAVGAFVTQAPAFVAVYKTSIVAGLVLGML